MNQVVWHGTRQKSLQCLVHILGETMNSQINSEIYWLLAGRFYFIIPCFGEKRVERIISYSNCVIWWHLTIWMDPMFQAIELPGCIAHLAPSLAHMNGDHFSLELNQTKGNFEPTIFKIDLCMGGPSHIQSILISVEYWNCQQTLDVYLLVSILIGQSQSKRIYKLRKCIRNLYLRVQVHPGELWASKSAGARSDVPKICGFVHPLHPYWCIPWNL